eukprot:5291425-Pleurochrysis_carterae.AAC.1
MQGALIPQTQRIHQCRNYRGTVAFDDMGVGFTVTPQLRQMPRGVERQCREQRSHTKQIAWNRNDVSSGTAMYRDCASPCTTIDVTPALNKPNDVPRGRLKDRISCGSAGDLGDAPCNLFRDTASSLRESLEAHLKKRTQNQASKA